jgi:hypothetical protein
MPYNYNHKRIELVILDFLNENDFQSGQKLEEDLRYITLINNLFSISRNKIIDLESFDNKITWIINQIQTGEIFPLIHFEAHGNLDGLQYSKNKLLKWEIILKKIRDINILLVNNLFISISACKGSALIYKINYWERAPFRSIVGPAVNLNEVELYEGFYNFYDTLFYDFDINKAYEKLSETVNNKNDKLTIVSSDTCFDIFTDINENSENFVEIIEPYRQISIKNHPTFKLMPIDMQIKESMRGLKVVLDGLRRKKDYFSMNDL